MSLANLYFLPDEIWHFFIFKDPKLKTMDYFQLSLVCKRFSFIVHSLLYRKVIINQSRDQDFFTFQYNIDKFSPYAKFLTFDLPFGGDSHTVKFLSFLDSDMSNHIWTEPDIARISSTVTSLIKHFIYLSTVHMDLSNLCMNEVDSKAKDSAWNGIITIFDACSKLESLRKFDIFFSESMTESMMILPQSAVKSFRQCLQARQTSLKELTLKSPPSIYLSELHTAKNLKSLTLDRVKMNTCTFHSFTNQILIQLPEKLLSLALESPRRVNFTSLVNLLKPCSSFLKYLTINDPHWAKDSIPNEPTDFNLSLPALEGLECFDYYYQYQMEMEEGPGESVTMMKDIDEAEVALRFWNVFRSCPILQLFYCYDISGSTETFILEKLIEDDRNWSKLRFFKAHREINENPATSVLEKHMHQGLKESVHFRAGKEGIFEVMTFMERVLVLCKEMNPSWVESAVEDFNRFSHIIVEQDFLDKLLETKAGRDSEYYCLSCALSKWSESSCCTHG